MRVALGLHQRGGANSVTGDSRNARSTDRPGRALRGHCEFTPAGARVALQAVKVDCSRLSRQRDDSFCREMAGKGATAAYPAADFQFCIVMIKHVFYDRQSQAGATGIT